jgi:hypothetical protein
MILISSRMEQHISIIISNRWNLSIVVLFCVVHS